MTPQPDNQAWDDVLLRKAALAFERECSALSRDHAGEWAAYHGDERVGLAKSRAEAWQLCLQRGLREGEFWVFNVQPIIGVEVMGLGMTAEQYEP